SSPSLPNFIAKATSKNEAIEKLKQKIISSKEELTIYDIEDYEEDVIERRPSIQKNETKITVDQGSSCLAGITQGIGCVIGAILAVILILFLLLKSCSP